MTVSQKNANVAKQALRDASAKKTRCAAELQKASEEALKAGNISTLNHKYKEAVYRYTYYKVEYEKTVAELAPRKQKVDDAQKRLEEKTQAYEETLKEVETAKGVYEAAKEAYEDGAGKTEDTKTKRLREEETLTAKEKLDKAEKALAEAEQALLQAQEALALAEEGANESEKRFAEDKAAKETLEKDLLKKKTERNTAAERVKYYRLLVENLELKNKKEEETHKKKNPVEEKKGETGTSGKNKKDDQKNKPVYVAKRKKAVKTGDGQRVMLYGVMHILAGLGWFAGKKKLKDDVNK